jgi:DNA-binding response OmpR family regulator
MATEDAARPLRVLVVDDDHDLNVSLEAALRLAGNYDVLTAEDGVTGLERSVAVPPDCVVVDIRMPGLDGYQFIRALRGDPVTAQTPIVVLSALVQERDAWAGLLSGADAYLFKPVSLDDLLEAVHRAIQLTAEERRQWAKRLAGESEESGTEE